jgi:hypothetical protein
VIGLALAVVPARAATAAPGDGTVRTFDAEAVGAPPVDCTSIGDVTVAAAAFGGAVESNRALRLSDQSSTVYTRTWCRYPLSAERSVSYRFSPAQLNYGPIVAIQGGPGTSANGVWRFTLNRDGNDLSITAYNGSVWSLVATVPGGAVLGRWQDLTINATLDRAELIVNGVRFQTQVRNATSTGLGDIYFGSAGTSPGGVDYYIDDLAVSGELPGDAFAGVPVEPLFVDTGVTQGIEIVDAPVARFRITDLADPSDYSVVTEWRGSGVPADLSGPDADGWVTASITHTFTQAGSGMLRTLVTDSAGVTSASAQPITVIGVSNPTFESDAVGSVPSGCATPDGLIPTAVSDEIAHQGEHSLRVRDTSTSATVGVTCPLAPQQGAYLSFHIHPWALQGFTVDLVGQSLLPTGQPGNSLFRLSIRGNGGIQWYETWTATWRELAPAGTVPVGRWSQVQLAVPADNAAVRVTVDGAYVGSAGSTVGNNSTRHNGITAITGFAFGSGGSGNAATGDDVFLDDVIFGGPSDTPASAVGTAPFHISETTTIDDDGQVGFPGPGVVVPNGDGQRVLIPYSAHPDTTAASGFRLASSDDGGVTWASAQGLNPMPDTAGAQPSRLRNGDLLAVNFHTYMTPDSGNRQAVVETAVSHDNGATWTHRSGLMTTAEAMRPIGASERPGTTLGGFVLSHSVLEDPDGTLYQSAYGVYAVDQKSRVILLVSHDRGVNWTVAGTVAIADPAKFGITGYDGPSEGAIERIADGSLLMIIRNGWRLPMTYSRSTDNGATWSVPQQVEVGPAGQALLSVQPTLELLPTGELLLLVGRPGLVMTMSESGLGDDWSIPVGIDYVNSENGGFTVLDPSTVVVVGDRGRAAPWEVWSRQVTIDQPGARTVTGVHDGPLSAGAGGLCLVDATVNGAVTVTGGGRLVAQGSTIDGPVNTSGASVVSLCGSNIEGPVTLNGTTGNVAIGDTTNACDTTTITGPLRVTGTSGHVVVDRAEVAGPVSITGNGAALATVLAGLTVHGPLSCAENAVAPTDSGVANTVDGPSTGQCAALT